MKSRYRFIWPAAMLLGMCLTGAGLTPVRAAVLPAVSGGAGAHAPAAVRHTALQSLVIRASDLPRGFRRHSAHLIGNTKAARLDRVSLKTFNRHGRQLSYQVVYTRRARGVNNVDNIVVRFKSSSGAHWDYLRTVHAALAPRAMRGYRSFHWMRVRRIGQESNGFGFYERSGRTWILVDVLRFRRGSYRVTLKLEAPSGSVRTQGLDSYTAGLASLVDRRLRSAH